MSAVTVTVTTGHWHITVEGQGELDRSNPAGTVEQDKKLQKVR